MSLYRDSDIESSPPGLFISSNISQPGPSRKTESKKPKERQILYQFREHIYPDIHEEETKIGISTITRSCLRRPCRPRPAIALTPGFLWKFARNTALFVMVSGGLFFLASFLHRLFYSVEAPDITEHDNADPDPMCLMPPEVPPHSPHYVEDSLREIPPE